MTPADAFIDCTANVVPDQGLYLPLVDQTRGFSLQDEPWVDGHHVPRLLIGIEEHAARGHLSRQLCLAAGPWALDQNAAGPREALRQFSICDPRNVGVDIDPIGSRRRATGFEKVAMIEP
nr:hypothetical protein [Candidatus Palauibacter scopulicola]